MQQLESVHGVFEGCLQTASGWVILTSHTEAPGEVGTLDCNGNSTCMDGTQPHSLSDFTWQTAPAGNALTVLGQDGSNLILQIGTGELIYSLTTGTFGQPSGSGQ